MKRLLLALGLSLPAIAAPALIRNTPAIFFEGAVDVLRTGDFNGDAKLDFVALSGDSFVLVPGNGDGTFGTAIEIDAGLMNIGHMNAADLDDDGDLDLIVSDINWITGAFTYRPFLNDGSGGFTAGTVVTMFETGYSGADAFVLGDVTGDTKPDLVVCGGMYFPGAGDGTFGARVGNTGCSPGEAPYLFDANADGDLDVLLAYNSAAFLLRNDGSGTFTQTSLAVRSTSVAIADFDNNGQQDFTWRGALGDRPMLMADASGAYGTAISANYQSVLDLIATDVNDDGRPDVVGSAYGHVWVWITAADGTSNAPAIYAVSSGASLMAAGDFDDDGNVDLLSAGADGSVNPAGAGWFVSFVRGTGAGAFDAARSRVVVDSTTTPTSLPDIAATALSDITGDGKLDLIAVTYANHIALFPGNGDGTFADAVMTSVTGSLSGSAVTFTDLNADGKLDVIRMSGSTLQTWLAQPAGTFTNVTNISTFSGRLVSGDFSGDGKQDILIVVGTILELRRGAGDGTFSGGTDSFLQPSISQFEVVTGDANGDGRMDLIGPSFTLLSTADGGFTRVNSTVQDPVYPSLAVDLNADGKVDLIKDDKQARQGAVHIQLGNGDGTFAAPRRTDLYSEGHAGPRASAADFDGDGNVDLLLGTTILLGDGTGTFDGYARFRTGTPTASHAIGDLDANNSPDFVATNNGIIDIVRTKTVESLALPLTTVVEELDEPVFLGEERLVEAELTGETAFAADNAVMFSLGGVAGAFAEPSEGDAASTMILLPAGSVSLVATYLGDPIYAPAVSAATPTVTIDRGTVTHTAAFIPASPTTLMPVRLTGSLTGAPFVVPTGTIAVTLDGNSHSTVNAPSWDINFGILSAGTHTVVLQYNGDANWFPKTIETSVTVSKVPVTFNLNVGATFGFPVGNTFVAAALFPNHPGITGSVRFLRNDTVVGTAPINNGTALLEILADAVGWTTIRAIYLGNDTFAETETASYTFDIGDVAHTPGPSSLYLVTPCRMLDTRDPVSASGGPILVDIRHILMTGRCGIPSGARALAVNVTAVTPSSDGYVLLRAATENNLHTSTMSFRSGKTRANNAIVALSKGGYMLIQNSNSFRPVHVIVDVTGYFK